MTDEKDAQRFGVKRHALWLAGAAVGVYVTYMLYVYVFTLTH